MSWALDAECDTPFAKIRWDAIETSPSPQVGGENSEYQRGIATIPDENRYAEYSGLGQLSDVDS